MLKRLQIRNFRGFNALEIDQLSGINLIAGKNNSGKTSLLEAISLLVGAGDAR
ncbi:MAG: AAA family ATPase, partial [Gemmatimonadota bacterium]|nr:AAA family ATPase [Gemmatimonadota bacterium]